MQLDSEFDSYPLPRIGDLYATLAGGQLYSKLDMSQAYHQLVVEESSRPCLTINTHRGLFTYTVSLLAYILRQAYFRELWMAYSPIFQVSLCI